uniref:Uncharacterized protein n=1 Tax=Avena sativa TaxID=4498 RepID=A0ACD6A003_AVESA
MIKKGEKEDNHSARLSFAHLLPIKQSSPETTTQTHAPCSSTSGGEAGWRAMAFLFGALLGLVLGVAVVMALARLENSRAEQRRELAATVSSFSKLTVQDLKTLIPPEFYPSWLKWLNHELVKIWPFVNEAASELIKTSVEPVFEQYKSFILASIHFSKLTLGTVAPQFTGVQLLDSDSAGITMELEMQWDGNPNIVLDIQTTLGISLPVQVKNIGFTGVLRLLFKPLVAELPCFGAVCVSLREKSKVDFTLKVVGGEMTAIPGISDAIEGTIRDTIEDTLTWPNRIIVPIVPGDYSDLELKPVGLLEVKLVEARDLKNKDLVGKSDPFAMLYIRPLSAKTKKSKTINNDLNPIWNEHYEFVVEDSSTQHLTVKIYDDEGLQPSEIIGCARVELAGLQPGKVKDVWLELVKDLEIQRDKKPRGQVSCCTFQHNLVLYTWVINV